MVTNHIDFDSPEGKTLIRNLYAYASVHFKRLYRGEMNERGKGIHEYVADALEKHLLGQDNYDPARSPLEYHLMYNVIRQSIYNDLPPHAKRTRAGKNDEAVDTNLVPISKKPTAPSVAPAGLGSHDVDLLFKKVGERSGGDHVVEQIVLAIWLGGFELSNRTAICKEYNLTQAEFDKGKKRFMTILGHAFKGLNWKIE